MKQISQYLDERSSLLLKRVDELRISLRKIDPYELGQRVGGFYSKIEGGRGEMHLLLWGADAVVTFPELVGYDNSGQRFNPVLQALLVYYFFSSDGAASTGRYIAFSELPDGRFYAQAFQGYTGEELRRAFGDDRERFERAAQFLGGKHHPLGDSAYIFQFLPKVALLVVFWGGDEDFPSSYQVLFDTAAPHHLPTDACAIAGSLLTRHLIASPRG